MRLIAFVILAVFPTVTLMASPYSTTVTTVDYPGATNTHVFGINDSGEVVGYFDVNQGFIRRANGTFQKITIPGLPNAIARDINNDGVIVGYSFGSDFFTQSFVLQPNGAVSLLSVPSARSTAAYALDDSGQVVGFTSGPGSQPSGFLFSNGIYSTIADPPGSVFSISEGIDGGWMGVNSWNGVTSQAFLVSPLGVYITIDVPYPGVNGTGVSGVNAKGDSVGSYGSGPYVRSFVRSTSGDYFRPNLGFGGSFISVSAINNYRQIAGTYMDPATGAFRSFITSPLALTVPEPAAVILTGVGCALFVLCKRNIT